MSSDTSGVQYDISNCEREPIHRLGRVQSQGALMAFSADWLLVSYSENLSHFCNKDPETLLGRSANELLTQKAVSAIASAVAKLQFPDQVERIMGQTLFDTGKPFDVSLHLSGDYLIVEFEPVLVDTSREDMEKLRQAFRSFSQSDDVSKLCQSACKSVAEMIGFDRVMIYRFHPDDSGEVVAEHRLSDVDSFLGLRYPASDIPQQARALYKRNLTRIASDIDDPCFNIVPRGTDIDLSLSVLRAVSPIHIEYLRNMGVKASYSISILVDGELWGLIACHNHSPKSVSSSTRTYTELFAESFALELRSRLDKEGFIGTEVTRRLHVQMMAGLDTSLPLIENLRGHGERLKALIPCASLVIIVDNEHVVFGDPVNKEDISVLVKNINSLSSTNISAIDSMQTWLNKDLTIAERFAGFLAVPVSRRPRDMLIFLRREEAQSVVWAGNPEKPVELGVNGSRLTPRKSFAAWTELRSGYCAPWNPTDLSMAGQIKNILLEVIVRNIDDHSRLTKDAQQQQDMLIHELNHRVRNILGLINSIVGQTATSVETVAEFKTILAGRIQALALAQNMLTERNWSYAPFTSILETEFDAFVDDRSRVLTIGPDIMLSPKAYTTLTLVIHELVTNATKYGALSTSRGTIEVVWRISENNSLVIDWSEGGVTIESAPTRRGFGSLIIDRALPFDLNGSSKIEYKRSGLVAQLSIPSTHIEFDEKASKYVLDKPVTAPPAEESASKDVKSSGSALIVEDNMIIALDEEVCLIDYGFKDVVLCTSVAAALQSISKSNFEFAILDVNLGRENSEPIADRLKEQGVPFIFATGYNEGQERLRERFDVPILAKPFTSQQLVKLVDKVVRRKTA